jgi:2-dehydro-3-deoxygluconokinase
MNALKIACIGECMIELWQDNRQPQSMQRTFGGDTLNTAIYAARCLRTRPARVDYVTALGDDPFSEELLQAWQAEGVGTSLVARLPERLPGLYMIRTTADGERSFYYWRSASAARELMHTSYTQTLLQTLAHYDFVYLSGISLAILDDDSRRKLLDLMATVRDNGGRVGFDSNYRPRLWPDQQTTRYWLEQVLTCTDIAFPTFDDEIRLYADNTPEQTAQRHHALGVGEVVVKCGSEPCLVSGAGGRQQAYVEPLSVARPVDTTAAGDSFNAAYFSARLSGEEPQQAAAAGHRLAASVISYQGAIIPAD